MFTLLSNDPDRDPTKMMTEWLAGHHILIKDVRDFSIQSGAGNSSTLDLKIFMDRVDELPAPKPMIINFSGDISKGDLNTFRETFQAAMSKPVQPPETSSDSTMLKVRKGLHRAGLDQETIQDAITYMQNEGILFREFA